jgi:hypothetical protein
VITTPEQPTQAIHQFCGGIVPGADPRYVPVRPASGARPSFCHANVALQVRRAGGKLRHGWTIWEEPGQFLVAEFHSIWESPSGELVDITPHVDGERTIMFLPDPHRKWESRYVPNRLQPLTNDPRVLAHIDSERRNGEFLQSLTPSPGSASQITPVLVAEAISILRSLDSSAGESSYQPRSSPKERAERRRRDRRKQKRRG